MKIYLLALISFLVGTSEYNIAGILDKVAADEGISLAAAGQLMTVFSLAYAIGTPIAMAMTSRMSRRRLMLLSLGIFALGNAAILLLPGLGFLLLSRIVLAVGTGMFVVTALSAAAKMAAPERRAGAIATVITGFSTALIVGVPLGRVVASAYDWKATFGVLGALGLLAIPVIARLIPDSEGDAPIPIRKQVALLRNPKIAIALAVTFLWILGYSIVYTYISPYLLSVAGLSEREVSIGLFAFGLASLIGSKIGGFATDRWGVTRTLLAGMTVHALALAFLPAAAGAIAATLPLLMLWSLSAWSSGPTQQFNLVSMAPDASSLMLSLNSSILQFGMAAGAGIGGLVVAGASLSAVTWIGAVGVAAAAAGVAMGAALNRASSRRRAGGCPAPALETKAEAQGG